MSKRFPSCLYLLVIAFAGTVAHGEDLLSADDTTFDSSALGIDKPNWTDFFRASLKHSHTAEPEATRHQRSSVRVEYSNSIAKGWYLRLDSEYRYFWSQDVLAEGRGGRYGVNKWHDAWLQYSYGSCAVKLGRQTLIWGEVEGTFVTDVIAPFDYTEQLLTDYSDIRLPQDMVVADCYFSGDQLTVFGVHEAKSDQYRHSGPRARMLAGLPPAVDHTDAGEEWGMKYKWRGTGYDVSLLYARLHANAPTVQIEAGRPVSALSRHDMLGAGGSLAIGRLLLKAELAYKKNWLTNFNQAKSDRWDAAIGFEYTTSGNHSFNGGIWGANFDSGSIPEQNIQVITAGWRKGYINDDLTVSLLGSWVSFPRIAAMTVLAEYQWTDFWNVSLALGGSDMDKEAATLPQSSARKFVTATVKYEF